MRTAAPGERVASEFGRLIARLHERLGGDRERIASIERWARHAWCAADDGHVCVAVSDAGERAALAASPLVGTPASLPASLSARPLVLDLDALYLCRLWRAECALAQALASLDAPAPLAGVAAVDAVIGQGFERLDPADPQQRALRRALGHRLTVLSGGPGTGKTTTLARLLVAYARLAPGARIAFAAPTGKAAARLAQSLTSQLGQLDASGELRARLPTSGTTVHRLLGARADGLFDRVQRLDHDLVIVDEASMLDIELAASLVASIGEQARLVLAGDRDQLASVEAGAVFADVCASAGEAVVTLERNYRQQDAAHIVALARQVRAANEVTPAIDWPAQIALLPPDAGAIVDEALAAWREAREAIVAGVAPEKVLAVCDRHRVLTALRDGPLGSVALNRAIAATARRESHGADWYPGRLVMVTRNEPGLGLFNGDVGVCLPRPGGARLHDLVVAFEGPAGSRLFPVLQMPACEDAWAITVHKSQGSEFESVSLVPAPSGHPLNTRELLYTGITRARCRLSIRAMPGTIEEAARTRTQRHGRLALRLARALRPGAGEGADPQ